MLTLTHWDTVWCLLTKFKRNLRDLSTCEAIWRILEFDIHYRTPFVERLTVHLPGMNNVRFEPDASLTYVLDGPAARSTMLTAWFDANSKHTGCRHLTYCDFPKEWSWDALQ
jgi:hypothetical protein